MKSSIILVYFFLWTGLKILAQPNFSEMPKFTPQSPEAASLNKYGEYQVSMFTGLPEISIPLFEIKTGKFSVPITLSYHASGIKVNEFSGWIGLGWSLNEGGRISRTVRGREDLIYPMNVRDASTIDEYNYEDYLYLKNVEENSQSFDTDPDIYQFSFPGKSGRFVFIGTDQVNIPYCGVKVAGFATRNKLIDEKGSLYFFEQEDHPTSEYPSKNELDPVSSWLLTKMVDAGRTDSILYTYQSAGMGCLGIDFVDYIVVDDNASNYGGVLYHASISTPVSYNITTWGSEVVPASITWSQGIAKFILSNDNRQDRPNYGGTGTGFKTINKIEIYSIDNLSLPKKTIKFYTSYFENLSDKRLRLDSVQILDLNLTVVQRYKFNYNETVKLPAYDSKRKDLWGYFNNVPNSLLLPRLTIPFVIDGGSNTFVTIGSNVENGRDPNPSTMQAYILNKITYPTGGYTLFEYETNKYLDGTTPKYAGGLRIAKIKSYNEDGICQSKIYKYGENESGYGYFNVFMSDFYFSTPPVTIGYLNFYTSQKCTKRTRTFTSNPCTDLIPFDGSPVVYPTVSEYWGDENSNTGKTIYTYTTDPDVLGPDMNIDSKFKLSKSFRRGLLKTKTVYSNINGVYHKVSYVNNNYFYYPTANSLANIRVRKLYQYEEGSFLAPDYFVGIYAWANTRPIFCGDNLLTSTYEYNYDINNENNYVLKVTTYNYNSPQYTQISSISSNDSRQNTSIIKRFKYPTDFTGTTVYNNMVSRNMLNSIVLEEEFLNGTIPTYSKRTNYDLYHNKFYAPSFVEFKTRSNPWEPRIRYFDYNLKGNVLSLSKENDVRTNYIWGYNDEFPVAEVIGSDYNTIYNLLTSAEKTTLYQNPSDLSVRTIIQKIRTNFINTNIMVSTYTHKPLIGLTSSTDPNGKITYYEYDSFGRLKNIKDQDLVIMKEINYHYKE